MIKQQILSGLAEEFSSVFLKMERAVTSFIRAISTDQIGAGLDKYQQILTSVRVMTASGIVESKAYESIDDLRDYVDQTSYSLTQMTDALSKMVSAGVNVDVATKSVQGIANACANAGINAQDAQRAFYNLAQAYGKGKLEFNDYRSLELLNMATATFKNQILEAAVEAKKLKKINDDTYKIMTGKGRGKKVNSKNLTDMMKYGFITNDVMDKLFGDKYYFSEKEMDKIRQELGIKKYNMSENDRERLVKEAKKRYGELAVESYLAAKEARSFTDVINTLKDVVSTGWSNTFENLFGKLEQAKDFFTALTEGEFAEAIYSIGEWRNAVLEAFNGPVGFNGELLGAKAMTNSILNLTDAIGILFKTILQILPGYDELGEKNQNTLQSVGENLRRTVADIQQTTLKIKDLANKFNEFMNGKSSKEDPLTRIQRLRKIFSNILSVVSIIGKVFSTAFNAVIRILDKLSPLFDGLAVAIEKVTEPLSSLKNNDKPFKDIEHSVDNVLTVIDPLIKGLNLILPILGDIGAFILQMSLDTVTMNIEFLSDALGFLLELIGIKSAQAKDGVGVIEGLKIQFQEFADVCRMGFDAVKTFFTSLIDDLRELFGLTEDADGKKLEKGGVFSRLTEFFNSNEFVKKAKAWIDQAIVDIGDFIKDIPNKVKAFGENVYSTIWKLFFYEKREDVGGEMKTNVYKTELGEWVENAIEDIKTFFKELPNKIIQGVGQVGNWINEIFDHYFGQKKEANTKNGEQKEVKFSSRFDEFLNSVITDIRGWFDNLPEKIESGLKSIGDFFSRLFKQINIFLFGKKKVVKMQRSITEDGKKTMKLTIKRYKTGFSKWLDDIIKEVKKIINNIPEYIKAGIRGAGDIISSIINALFGKDKNDSKDIKILEKLYSRRLEKYLQEAMTLMSMQKHYRMPLPTV